MRTFRKKRIRVCIGGYAGCGNLGDDAILFGILEGFRRANLPPGAIVVLSGEPARDRRRFGVRCVDRKNPFSVVFALLWANFFVLGGGTLLQDRTGRRSLFYYLLLLRLARFCGCRTVVAGGLGPLSGGGARRAVRRALDSCAALFLRDAFSLGLARELGVGHPRVSLGADPAFLLPDPPPLRAAFLQSRLVGDLQRPFLCVCPCGGVPTSGVAEVLGRELPGFFPVFLLCDAVRDRAPALELRKRFGGILFSPRDASEAMALFGAAALTLSCRLHPLILSVRVGARCVCFSGGDPKLAAFCRSAGIPLFPAEKSAGRGPCALELLSRPLPDPREFCRTAAKSLAILAGMVYNGREETSPAQDRGNGRNIHEKRAVGGSAPPDNH